MGKYFAKTSVEEIPINEKSQTVDAQASQRLQSAVEIVGLPAVHGSATSALCLRVAFMCE